MADPTQRRLLRESRPARRALWLSVALGLASAICIIAQAALLAHVIARAAVDHAPLSSLAAPFAALVVVALARAALAGGFELTGRAGASAVMSQLRADLAEKVLTRSPVPRAGERTGEVAAAAVQGVDALQGYFAGYLPQLVLAVAVPAAVLVWIAPIDPWAAGVLAITIPLLILFMILVGKGARERARARWQVLAQLGGHFVDVVRGLPTLRAYRRDGAQADTIERVSEQYRRQTMGTLRLAFLSALVLELCAMIGTALVAATIGIQLDAGHLSLQAGLTVLLLAPELYAPLRAVGQQFHASADGLAAAERICALLDEPDAVADPETAAHVPSAGLTARRASVPDPRREPVALQRVSFAYPDRDELVLSDLDLELAPGRLAALVGPSGAGKSTVAALLLRLVAPASGRVSCGGVDLRELDAHAWRAQIAWVAQRTRLFAATIGENIALADPSASFRRIQRAAADAGLAELLRSLPDGLDTRVGDGGRGLSAGQAQRVGLARAFVLDAPLVILDEPTAHLDAATAADVGGAISRLAVGRTTLLIAHSAELVAQADDVIQLKALEGAGRGELAEAVA